MTFDRRGIHHTKASQLPTYHNKRDLLISADPPPGAVRAKAINRLNPVAIPAFRTAKLPGMESLSNLFLRTLAAAAAQHQTAPMAAQIAGRPDHRQPGGAGREGNDFVGLSKPVFKHRKPAAGQMPAQTR